MFGNSTQSSPEQIRSALGRILRSKDFARADRLSRFQTFVVELKLAGRESDIKETTLAIEVFGRDGSYDPAIDSVVRVEARRLRAKLAAFYNSEGASEVLRLEIPKGTYVPVVLGGEEILARLRRRRLRALATVAAVILAAGLAWAAHRANRQSRIHHLLEEAARVTPLGIDYNLLTSAQRNVPRSLASLMNAAVLFEQVLQLEPRNAQAHAGLARTYWLAGDYNPEMLARARTAADRALALGLVLPDYHFFRGYTAFFADNDFQTARDEFLRAIRLDESNDFYYRYYADASWITGQVRECEPVLRRGLGLHPGSDTLAVVWVAFLTRTGQFEEALRAARQFVGRTPTLHTAHRTLGMVLARVDRLAEAVPAYEECLRLSVDDRPCLSSLARAHAGLGDTAKATALLDRLIQLKAAPIYGAQVSMALRRYDDAVAYHEKSAANRDGALYYLKVEPLWRPLDGNPRFQAIADRTLTVKRR